MNFFSKFYEKYEKETLTLGLFFFFTIPYLLINWLSVGRASYSLNLIIDEKIPFLIPFVLAYLSMYILALLPYFLVKKKDDFRQLALVYFVILSFCYLIFLLFPVEMIRPSLAWVSGLLGFLMNWLYSIDPGYNCFPSIHVAIAFFVGLVCFRYQKRYWWVLTWAILVAVSTLLIKQHYFLDVVGGWLVSLTGYLWWDKILMKNKKIY